MFIQNLSVKQQAVLLYLAHEVANADGFSDEIQLGMTEILRAQMPEVSAEAKVEISELSGLFKTQREKHSLLLELLGVAHANQEYHSNEKDLIGQYADALDVSTEQLAGLEDWVEKQLALSIEAEQLLG